MLHECPYCGDVFDVELKKGNSDESPPCLTCAFEGKEPKKKSITEEK